MDNNTRTNVVPLRPFAHLHEQQLDFMNLCEMSRYTLPNALQEFHSKKLKQTVALWCSLIDEECNKELLKDIRDRLLSILAFDNLGKDAQQEYDIDTLVLIADGGIDTIYVVMGLLNTLGMPIEELFNEVQSTNMAKGVDCKACNGTGNACENDCTVCEGSGKTVLRRSDGKVLKPEGWRPPDLKAIILKHLQRNNDNADGNTAVRTSDGAISEGTQRSPK